MSSLHCDCGPQLNHYLKMMQKKGSGILLYLRQEGRGMGLTSKVQQYKLMRDTGIDTVEAAVRFVRLSILLSKKSRYRWYRRYREAK